MIHRRRIVLAVVLIAGLCAAAAPLDAAQGERASISEAHAAALKWLAAVDSGNYAESWKTSASIFRDAISEQAWAGRVGAVRRPLGAVVSRRVSREKFTTSLPGAPDGRYVVIQFRTSFANKRSAVETVTPMLDGDGKWRVSGYYIR